VVNKWSKLVTLVKIVVERWWKPVEAVMVKRSEKRVSKLSGQREWSNEVVK
jgi:hypothetical protein